MTYTNLSNQNVSSFNNLFSYANTITNGWLGIGIVIMTFFISFLSLQGNGYDFKRSFSTSSFLTTLIAIFLRVINLLSDKIMFISILITAFSVILIVFDA